MQWIGKEHSNIRSHLTRADKALANLPDKSSTKIIESY